MGFEKGRMEDVKEIHDIDNDLTKQLAYDVVKHILDKFENNPEKEEYRGNREERVLMFYDCDISKNIKHIR